MAVVGDEKWSNSKKQLESGAGLNGLEVGMTGRKQGMEDAQVWA